MYFFRSYFHNPPLADINSATYETFWVQLRGRTTVYMHMCTGSRNRIPFEHRERLIRAFEDVNEDYLSTNPQPERKGKTTQRPKPCWGR